MASVLGLSGGVLWRLLGGLLGRLGGFLGRPGGFLGGPWGGLDLFLNVLMFSDVLFGFFLGGAGGQESGEKLKKKHTKKTSLETRKKETN